MLQLEISDAADADMTELLRFGCATFGDAVGEAYFLSFYETFDLLCRYPEIAAVSPVFSEETRTYVHRSHRIFYRVQTERLYVGRVIHLARHIEGDLFDD